MNYETIENEIVGELNKSVDLTSIADVIVLPDPLRDYKTPTQKGLVTVVFLGEKYADNQSLGQVSQHTTLTFAVSVQARLLRGNGGLYRIAELIKQVVIGFAPSDCGGLSLDEHAYVDYQNDVWEHGLTFKCRALRTQEIGQLIPGSWLTDEEIFYKKQSTHENIHV